MMHKEDLLLFDEDLSGHDERLRLCTAFSKPAFGQKHVQSLFFLQSCMASIAF